MSGVRLALVIAAVAISVAGCGGPPPGLQNQWQSMMAARQQYEMCTAWRYREISACDAVLAVYRAERARYNADLAAKRAAVAP
jgi:hypothetical protein